MKRTLLFILFSVIVLFAISQDPSYQQKLYYTCKVWGFVKYYHSRVSICQVNWDSVLVSALPLIKSAGSNNDFNDALASMLSAAGPTAIATTPSPDTLPAELKRNLNFGWINDPVFRNDIKILLDTIKNNFRPHDVCWVKSGAGTSSYLSFPYDDPMIDSNAYAYYPTEFRRLTILFKYWNIINYFNPYNYVQEVPWDSTLFSNVLPMVSASDYPEFFTVIKKIAAGCDDAHVEGLTYSSAWSLYGNYRPKLILRYSQNNYVVVKSGYSTLSTGDIIVSVDGTSTKHWEDSLRPYISAGNPAVFRRFMCSYLLRGGFGSQAQIVYKDSTGTDHTLSTSRDYIYDIWFSSYYPNDTLEPVKFKLWNSNVGYVNMGKLTTAEVDSMYYNLFHTSAIIFDMRNYPNGTAWPIANWMYPERKCFAKLTKPDIFYPGTYSWSYDYLGANGNPFPYSGKVIILCNQETQSQAEYSCMILKAMPNSVIIGSQTAGADGNITKFKLSQEIQTGYTNLGVFYPYGDSTQRIGIVPDSLVFITAEGVRQGRDEVLEKALQVAGCLNPILSVTPSTRDVVAAAGTAPFIITCNTNWSAVSDAAWCTVDTSGSGNAMIVAEYSENSTYQPRIANINVTVTGMPEQTITLTQAKSTLGIEQVQKSAYRIFPNPTKGLFYVVPASEDKNVIDVIVQDLRGRTIHQQHCNGKNEYGIDLSSAPQGIYDIILKTDNILFVYKLTIIK
jgi:carboxyl-terminal processing protease